MQSNAPSSSNSPTQSNKNNMQGLWNILFNILLPVFILNQGHKVADPKISLVIALSFPLGFGIFELLKTKKVNPLSVFGLLNVFISGGLTLLGLGGIWFCIKEAAFPALIGAFVFYSATTDKPFINFLILNPALFDVDLLNEKLKEKQNETAFKRLQAQVTRWLSLSFFISAGLNFTLAKFIFTPLADSLNDQEKSVMLNQQLSKMTSLSFPVILVPSVIILLAILWYFFKEMKSLTGLNYDQVMRE